MKNIKLFILGIVASVAFASCTTTYPYTATNNPIGSKKGVSKTAILFGGAGPVGLMSQGNGYNLSYGLVFNSNFGVIEAAEKGKLNRLATIDIKVTDYLIFRKAEIIVTGD